MAYLTLPPTDPLPDTITGLSLQAEKHLMSVWQGSEANRYNAASGLSQGGL